MKSPLAKAVDPERAKPRTWQDKRAITHHSFLVNAILKPGYFQKS